MELKRENRTQAEAARFLGITTRSFNKKMRGESNFTSDEMFALQKMFFPEKTLEYLFQKEN